jgi:hypothetical protein
LITEPFNGRTRFEIFARGALGRSPGEIPVALRAPSISSGLKTERESFLLGLTTLKNYLDKGQGKNDNGKQRITGQNNKRKQNLLRIAPTNA